MSDNLSDVDEVLDHEYLEVTLLIAVNALLGNANRAATELGCGFRFVPEGLVVEWPDVVQQAMGLTPSGTFLVSEDERICRLLFKPCGEVTKQTYWKLLFPKHSPSLVTEYSVGPDEENNLITPTGHSWLVWPWHAGAENKANVLKNALTMQSALENEIDWLAAAKASALEKRPALFEAVSDHLKT